jgi:hypothetical protein
MNELSRAINAIFILVINKSTSRYAVGWFRNHSYDYGINSTYIRSFTIINRTAVQLMIFSKQRKWRKDILNTNVKRNWPRGTRWKYKQTETPNFALTKELNENTNKSTKFWLKVWQDWALAREYDVDIEKYSILSC